MMADIQTENTNTFILKRSEIDKRLDPYYCNLKKSVLNHSSYEKTAIRRLFKISDGDHAKFPPEHKSDVDNGYRYLRVQDLVDGEIIDKDPVYISEEYFQKLKRSHIEPGDILFSVMASLGTIAVVPEGYPICTANRAVGILKPKTDKILPKYFEALFKTPFGSEVIELSKRGGIQQRINLEDLGNLKIPIPPMEVQKTVVEYFHQGVNDKKSKKKEADKLLLEIESLIYDDCGISKKERDDTIIDRVFQVSSNQLSGGRYDSFFYLPYYTDLLRSIQSTNTLKLKDIATFSKEIWNQKDYFNDTFPYIEISEINLKTGKIELVKNTSIKNAPSRAKKIVRVNDIIISTTRPSRGAIAMISENEDLNICSTGFAVLRTIVHPEVQREYLFWVLRSTISLHQMEQRSSGGNYPAITEDQLREILIPVPSKSTQKNIIQKLRDRYNQHEKLLISSGDAEIKIMKKCEKIIIDN